MSDDDWETNEVVIPTVVPPGSAKAPAAKQWEDEDQPAAQDGASSDPRSKEQLLADLHKLEREFASYKKSKEVVKKKLTAQEKLAEALMTPEERKKREKDLADADQMQRVKDLFGESSVGEAGAADFVEEPKEKKNEVVDTLQLITEYFQKTFQGKDLFANVDKLMKNLTVSLDSEKLKQLGDTLVSNAAEKRKAEQQAKKKKQQEEAKKPVDAKRGVKASGKLDVKAMMEEEMGIGDEEEEEDEFDPDEDFM